MCGNFSKISFVKRLILLSLSASIFVSCNMIKFTSEKTKEFDWQGHRGCRGLLPENTIPAMLEAINLGVTTLEMDVVITKDKVVLVSHEAFLNHEISTKPTGEYVTEAEEKDLNIYQMTYAETKKFDVGLKPHPRFADQKKQASIKPTLAELIKATKAFKHIKYNIEIKSTPATDRVFHPEPLEFTELVMQVLKDENIESRTTLQSFDKRPLQLIHKKFPAISLSYLAEGDTLQPLKAIILDLGFTPKTFSPHYSLVTKDVVDQCHNSGIKIIPWTVNDKEKMKELIQLGVDGIITDYPNLISEVKQRL